MTLGYLAFAWLLGIAAAAFSAGGGCAFGGSGVEPWAAVAAASLLAATTLAVRPRHAYRQAGPAALLLALAGIGLVFAAAWRYESTLPPEQPTGIARYNDGDALRFRALVAEEPDPPKADGASIRYRLSARDALTPDEGWQPIDGGVLMTAPPFPRHDYGDLLELEGELKTPPSFDDFDYRGYLERRGMGSLVAYPKTRLLAEGQGDPFRAGLIAVRARLDDALAKALPEPEASLAAGVLLGRRSALPQDLTDAMNATSTSHLVAVSGQNVALVAALIIAALAWAISHRPAAWLALAAIVGYSLLVGGQPSVVRAAIMGGLYVVATALGRQNSAPQALALAGAAMTTLDPQLAKDVSFQLSFAATLGLMTLAPALRAQGEALAAQKPEVAEFPLTRPAIELTAVTLAAIAFTLPITAVNFERVSLVAPVANLLAVPAFIAVAVTAAVTATVGAIVPGAAPYLGWLAWPPAAYMTGVVRLLAELPFASVTLSGIGIGHAVGYFAALAALVWLLARRRPEPLPVPKPSALVQPARLLPAAGLALLLALGSLVLWTALTAPAGGRLSVTFLDVGQGDAILVRTPAGHKLLVDGGPSGEAVTAALGRHLPFWERDLDLVVLTHPQADHLTGLVTVLERYDVEAVLASPLEADTAAYRAWRAAVRAEGTVYHEATAGQGIALGKDAWLRVLHPPPGLLPLDPDDPNDNSLVLRLVMGDVAILLTADIGEEGELALIDQSTGLTAAVLQLPHHGSRASASPELLREVRPAAAVVSVGAHNPFGHPAPETLRRLEGLPVFRTDRHGDVTVSTDGHRLWVETQREGTPSP